MKTRKKPATALFICLIVILFSFNIPARAQGQSKPNIVILFADDMGYGDPGSYGNPYIRTPNIDELARAGQRWTDFYVGAPVCSPSRGTLLTGQLPIRSGLYGSRIGVMFPGDRHGIPSSLLTMAEALKGSGYRTGIFGKWHLGDAPDQFPTRHGFDYWYGIPYSNDMNREGILDYDISLKVLNGTVQDKALVARAAADFRDGVRFFDNPKSEYWRIPLYRSENDGGTFHDALVENPLDQPTFTRRLTEEAIRFIQTNHTRPFLLYMPYSMPHLPVFASKDFQGKSLRGAYGDAVEEIDWSVGRIRATLESLGLSDNTLVIFSSDNGPWQAVSTFRAGSAGMLRGYKGTTWEGGMRVPGVFWWPGKIQPAEISDIGTTMDVYATVLGLAGVPLPAGTDGLDLSATLFNGAPGPRNEMPYYQQGKLKAYRKGNYKIVFFGGERSEIELPAPQLYDLHQDISERQDIAADRPDILNDLLAAVERHRLQVSVAEPIFDKRLAE